MSTFWLKMIAIITMLIDHTGAVLFPEYFIMRIIGRLSFPIFAFLIANGFRNTKNPLKYSLRLLAFAFISEIPFDLAFSDTILDLSSQNVFFTLLVGLLAIWGTNIAKKKGLHPLIVLLPFLVGMAAAQLLQTDYSWMGVLAIFAFYMLGEDKLSSAFGAILTGAITMSASSTQAYAALSAIPIAFFNGKKGIKLKYLFYAFYPAHLLILWGIDKYIM